MARHLALFFISVYRRWFSPFLPPSCRFEPSCSQYATYAIRQFGPWRGILKAAWRLLKCHPLHPGGYDPVK